MIGWKKVIRNVHSPDTGAILIEHTQYGSTLPILSSQRICSPPTNLPCDPPLLIQLSLKSLANTSIVPPKKVSLNRTYFSMDNSFFRIGLSFGLGGMYLTCQCAV